MNKFRIYPFKKGNNDHNWDKHLWWVVELYKNHKAFKKRVNEKCNKCRVPVELCSSNTPDTHGLCHDHGHVLEENIFGVMNTDLHKKTMKGEIGKIIFHKDWLKPEVIAHECCHATMYMVRRQTNTIHLNHHNFEYADEYIAYALSNMVEQIHNRLYHLYEKRI